MKNLWKNYEKTINCQKTTKNYQKTNFWPEEYKLSAIVYRSNGRTPHPSCHISSFPAPPVEPKGQNIEGLARNHPQPVQSWTQGRSRPPRSTGIWKKIIFKTCVPSMIHWARPTNHYSLLKVFVLRDIENCDGWTDATCQNSDHYWV